MKCLIVIRPDRIGDVILSSSCIPVLRAAFPKTRLVWGTPAVMKPLFAGHPRLDGFMGLPDGKSGWWGETAEISERLREWKADAVVCLHPDSRIYAAMWRDKIERRVGYPFGGWSWTLNERCPDRRFQGMLHEAEYNFDLLGMLGVKRPEKLGADLALNEGDRASLETRIPWSLQETRFAVINPSAFRALRWPADRFAAVARQLQQERDWEIVVAGSSDGDHSVRECIRRLEQGRCRFLNLAGRINLGEFGWLLKHAQLSVSRDTGASHLAAAVGCPAVVVFARHEPPYGPTRWRPLSDRVAIVTPTATKKRWETRRQFWARGLDEIGVEEVCKAAGKVLSR